MSNKLIQDNYYYTVMFKDEQLTVPVIKTLIFKETFMRGDKLSCLFKVVPFFDDLEEEDFFVDCEHVSHLVVDKIGLIKRLQGDF